MVEENPKRVLPGPQEEKNARKEATDSVQATCRVGAGRGQLDWASSGHWQNHLSDFSVMHKSTKNCPVLGLNLGQYPYSSSMKQIT